MDSHTQSIQRLLDRVRARWRRLTVFEATARGALAVSAVLVVGWLLAQWTARAPMAAAALGVAALVAALVAISWALWPARDVPSDARVARFIEESNPELDDRLVSAVDVMAPKGTDRASIPSALTGPMLADAARVTSKVDPDVVVPGARLRRAGVRAAAAMLLLAIVAFTARDAARRSFDALSFALFPSRIQLEVTPGSAHVRAGSPVTIEARLVGNRAPVTAEVLQAESGSQDVEWRPTVMAASPSGGFRLLIPSVGTSFRYRVKAGAILSSVYDITVARPPRVTRIDLEFAFPSALGLASRTEEDSGDIYAPAGTHVRVFVHTDPEAASGQMTLADGQSVALNAQHGGRLTGSLTVVEDNSYRVALADRDGLRNPGDIEYFIRTLEDRPPDVHLTKPARDRAVTPLEEVDIEARADDDFGVERLELVYALRGGRENVVPLGLPRRANSVTGKYTLPLEDLNVRPGDFITYYARAWDLARGKRSSEARSDIFFLEVKPFDQGVSLASDESGSPGESSPQLDALVTAQKEVIVATWKLDRRTQASGGAKSEDDIRSVARAEADLKLRVEQTSSSFRESQMRDPRQRSGGASEPETPRAGQTTAEEDDMAAAAAAMGRAISSLNELKTAPALPPEMEALNHLLKAQADVKQRKVASRQAAGNSGSNRSNVDASNVFDKELQRQQQTNYETRESSEQRENKNTELEKIKDLARRQDELNQRQQELARARNQMTPEELKRRLETLTREQSDLRQRAEELARQMSQEAAQQDQAGEQQGQQGQQQGQQQGSQGSQGSQSSQGSQQAQGAPRGQGSMGQQADRMRAASEAMRNATNDLRQQDPNQAAVRGAQAVDQLRNLERQLEAHGPDDQRRALGDLQLEARQLADAERQMASELRSAPSGEAGKDALRRLAGEQDRLAARASKVQEDLKEQAAAASAARDNQAAKTNQAVAAAAREFDQKRVADRMKQSASQMRAAGEQPDAASDQKAATAAAAASEQETARDLDTLADKLASATGAKDEESQKLADQRARAEELQEKLNQLTDQVEKTAKGQGGAATAAELDRLQQEYSRQLQQTKDLLDQVRQEDVALAQGGLGFTFEGQGMTLSAPGTEAFKQDFAKWQQLRQQATQALDRAAASIARRQLAKDTRDRLASGVDDKPPAGYEAQVDAYFKALATKKKQ